MSATDHLVVHVADALDEIMTHLGVSTADTIQVATIAINAVREWFVSEVVEPR